MEPSLPLPLDPVPPPEADDKRLWIGNINNKLTEYNIVKIVQRFGTIQKFDFLFHKSGPLKGQPRGYCFVTYETKEQAEKALSSLNGRSILGKDLIVKWAHTVPSVCINGLIKDSSSYKKVDAPPVSSEEIKETKSVLNQIRAIESKLKAMDEQRDKELEMCLSAIPLAADNPLLSSYRNKSYLKQKPRNAPYKVMNRKNALHHKR